MDNHSNSEQHRVETLVKVYLVWDDIERQWALDPAIDPKYGPLDGLDSGDWGSECDCPRTDTLPGPGYDEVPAEERTAREEHEKVLDRAVGQRLPDAEQLLRMLADYLGYGLFRCPQIHHGGPGCAPDAAGAREVSTLLIDEDRSAFVYGVYPSARDAEQDFRGYLVERFGEQTVLECEADPAQGLGALVAYKVDAFTLPG